MDAEHLTGEILGAAIRIHREYGPGLLESVYEALLAHALEQRGIGVLRQQPVRLTHDEIQFEEAFRADLIIDNTVIVEIKSIANLEPVHSRQLLTYLRLTGLPLGLLLNFGAETLRQGIKRVINSPK